MKRILITGANRGLGLELARQYQAADWEVIATCRQPDQANDLRALGLTPLALDIADDASITALANEVQDMPLDVVFNNAGMFGPRGLPVGKLEAETWLEVLRVNTIAPMLVTQALLENVATSQDKFIVFMSSNLGSIARSSGGEYIYRSSKAALNMSAATLAKDLAPRGIRVVAMSPGWVRTDMGGDSAPLSVEDSVYGIKTVLDNLGEQQTGVFLNHDGTELPW
ncbi:MAG: SDR family oxidoreductase [Deinococcota bacterium]